MTRISYTQKQRYEVIDSGDATPGPDVPQDAYRYPTPLKGLNGSEAQGAYIRDEKVADVRAALTHAIDSELQAHEPGGDDCEVRFLLAIGEGAEAETDVHPARDLWHTLSRPAVQRVNDAVTRAIETSVP